MANKLITVSVSGVSPQVTQVVHGETVDFILASGSGPVDVYFDTPTSLTGSSGTPPDPLHVSSQAQPVTVAATVGFSVVNKGDPRPTPPGGQWDVVRGELDVTTPPELEVK